MAKSKTRSFERAVWKRYVDDIEKAVSDYIDENFANLNLRSRYVQEPNEAYLSSCNFHRAIAYDTVGDLLNFDVVVIAEIEIFQQKRSEAMDGEAQKWFSVACEVELSDGFKNFRVKSIEEYDSHKANPRKVLTDTLVPFIYASDLDKHAGAILAETYPEALAAPTKIDVRVFAERLGLHIKEARLSRNGTIFGQMIFSDCKVEYYDLDKNRFDSFDADAGTILVDPEVYFLRSLGSWNNTVIHECVHWKKHRKVFELERLYNENASRIRCSVTESTTDEQKRTDTEWMEWHANALAPRILMPLEPFNKKAAELIAFYKQDRQTERTAAIMPDVIRDLADFFGVSIQSAKIRLIDIGYQEAIGVFEYVDDRYVPSHSFGDGAIGKNQTFSVPITDSIVQYAFNTDFRRIIDSGNFVYIDAHYCINNPKYVVQNEFGVLEMTEYAVSHMDECCLVFDRTTRPNKEYGARRYTECALFQNAVSKNIPNNEYSHTDRNKDTEARAAMINAELSEVKEAARIKAQLPGSFGGSLVMLMKWRGFTNEQLAEKALVSSKTIQRIRNDPDPKLAYETAVKVCLGLQLPPGISNSLIEKAGFSTMGGGEKGFTFAHLLATQYKCTIYEFNEFLVAAGISPLSDSDKD